MGKVEVIFDDLNRLNINPTHKYVLYMHGCFCPPHRGHLEPITQILKKVPHQNLTIFVNQIGGKRHGVDRKTNYFIMETYLKELYSHINYRHFKDLRRDEILNDHNLRNIDGIIITKGVEEHINLEDHSTLNKLTESNNRKYHYLTRKYNVNVLYLDRIGYSATKFTENMIELKDKHNRHNKRENIRKCADFIPDIGNEHKKIILKKLVKHKLIV